MMELIDKIRDGGPQSPREDLVTGLTLVINKLDTLHRITSLVVPDKSTPTDINKAVCLLSSVTMSDKLVALIHEIRYSLVRVSTNRTDIAGKLLVQMVNARGTTLGATLLPDNTDTVRLTLASNTYLDITV